MQPTVLSVSPVDPEPKHYFVDEVVTVPVTLECSAPTPIIQGSILQVQARRYAPFKQHLFVALCLLAAVAIPIVITRLIRGLTHSGASNLTETEEETSFAAVV